ncbi:MAG: hypothetical protein OXE84_01585, partial [Rhodobacteraceae bacterium]|nr:hypothetical protein [Paracoccaceae bacterium]
MNIGIEAATPGKTCLGPSVLAGLTNWMHFEAAAEQVLPRVTILAQDNDIAGILLKTRKCVVIGLNRITRDGADGFRVDGRVAPVLHHRHGQRVGVFVGPDPSSDHLTRKPPEANGDAAVCRAERGVELLWPQLAPAAGRAGILSGCRRNRHRPASCERPPRQSRELRPVDNDRAATTPAIRSIPA